MSEFTLKTRLLAALKGEPVDKVPVCSVTQTGIVELMDVVGAPGLKPTQTPNSWQSWHSPTTSSADLKL